MQPPILNVGVSKTVSIFLGIILSFYVVWWNQVHIDRLKDDETKIEEYFRFPPNEYLRMASLGYEQLAASLLWLRVIQEIGKPKVTERGYEWLYDALEVVTSLDPKFTYAYQAGGVTLSILGNLPEKSNVLLRKGQRENPDVWQIPFYIGFNDFFYLKNYKSAANNMARASRLPGRPSFLPSLASRLFVESGNSEAALVFLNAIIQQSEDPEIKKVLLERMDEIRKGKVEGIFRKPSIK